MRLRFAVRACTRRRSTRVLGITAVLYGKSSPRYCFMIKSSALRFSSGSATVLQKKDLILGTPEEFLDFFRAHAACPCAKLTEE